MGRPPGSTTSGRAGSESSADTSPPSAPGSLQASRCPRAGSISAGRRRPITWRSAVSGRALCWRGVLELLGDRDDERDELLGHGSCRVERVLVPGAGRGSGSEPRGRTPSVATATTLASGEQPGGAAPGARQLQPAEREQLVGGGKWSNGVNGSNETGMRLVSNAMSCSKSTSCASWWNVAPFGPDTEVWGTVTALPGTGNQFRLYVRIQQPGSLAVDAYMLRTNQLAGTDEVYLERVDNSTLRASVDGESGACGRGHAAVAGEGLEAGGVAAGGARSGCCWGA